MQMVEIAKQKMLEHLPQNGRLLIGDVAFSTINDMEQCKKQAGNAWDSDEIYPVVEVLGKAFPGVQFEKISFCSGVISLIK